MSPLPLLAKHGPLEHCWNTWLFDLYYWQLDLSRIPVLETLGVTNFVVMMLAAATFLVVAGARAGAEARRAQAEGRPPRGLAHAIEVIVEFIRDQMMRPNMPHHWKDPFYVSVFATFFFFILCCNLIGLLPQPFGHTPTGTPWVTGALAFGGTFVLMLGSGIREKGPVRYWLGLVPHGVPAFMWPLLFVIELAGLCVKPTALTIRLWANMTAGHTILAVLTGFLMGGVSFVNAALVWPASAFGFAAITVFEVAIALIQAYIFTVLSTVFVGQALSHEH